MPAASAATSANVCLLRLALDSAGASKVPPALPAASAATVPSSALPALNWTGLPGVKPAPARPSVGWPSTIRAHATCGVSVAAGAAAGSASAINAAPHVETTDVRVFTEEASLIRRPAQP